MDGKYINLWSTDNDKTDANDDLVIKRQKVGDWSEGYILTPEEKEKLNVKGVFDKGWYFYTKPSKQGIPFFFPASGWRYSISGSLSSVTTNGFFWVADPTNKSSGRYLGFGSGDVGPLGGRNRSYGFTVRPAQEK